MRVKFHTRAFEELNCLPESVVQKFEMIFDELENGAVLPRTKLKKLSGNKFFEARVKDNSCIYQGICVRENDLVFVVFFQKKTQKTPDNILKLAIKRFKELN